MKRFVLSICTCIASLSLHGGDVPLPAPLLLDGAWRFHLAPTPEAADRLALDGFHRDDFDATDFKPIPVPSCWVMHGFEEPHYVNGTTSEGFYLHRFSVPKEAEGRRAILRFGGVWQSAEVWLNGQLLGRNDSGFTQMGFDATRAIKAGAENRIAVRVRQQTPTFKFDANDDWALPGIYRSVWVEFTRRDWWLADVQVETDFDEAWRDAELRLRVHVMRDERAEYNVPSPPVTIAAVLAARDGAVVQRGSIDVSVTNGYNGREAVLALPVRAPAPWTAETPDLYDLRVELRRGDTVLHAWGDRIGFREVSTEGGVLRVNGRPVKLRGVNRHDLAADVGRATRPEDWRADLELMRAANINAVRTAHYPPAEGFLRLCDEMGFYVVGEIPFGFGGERMNDPAYAAGAFQRVHDTVARDRNRPSVIVWSLGNEDPVTALHVATLRALKALDPTRPVLLPFQASEDLPPEVDILAPHYWKAEEYDRLAREAKRPIITTEYTHALGPDDFGELQERWDALTTHAAGAGGMIWLWADQGIRRPLRGRTPLDPMLDKAKITREGSELVLHKWAGPDAILDAHGNLGTDGIVDADREPQRAYWETRAVYAPVRVLVDHLPFEAGQAAVRIPLRNDYDFTDLSTVDIGWRLLRGDRVVAAGQVRSPAAPHTQTVIEIPTTALEPPAPGTACAVHLTFTDRHGRELTTRSVRLGEASPPAARALKVPVRLVHDAGQLHVDAGTTRYTFHPARGVLTGIRVGEVVVARGLEPVVWRAATFCERNQLDRRPKQHPWDSWLQTFTPKALSWDEADADGGLRITASVEHRHDEANAVIVDYVHTILPTGALRTTFTVRPSVELEWLPEIGLELRETEALRDITWVGLGPGDSLPNRRASALFGHWAMDTQSPGLAGMRSGVAWLQLGFGPDVRLRVHGPEGFRVEGGGPAGRHVRLLTRLAGAWTKNGPAERPEWRLETKDGATFSGAIEIEPVVGPLP